MRIRFVSRMLAVLGLFAAASAAGAQAGTVAGRVTHAEGGAPVAGARVQVMTGATAVGAAQTADDGSYRIGNIAAGTYSVLVQRIGFAARRTDGVSVTAGQTTTLNVTVSELAAQLNQVVTTGTRGAEPEKILDSPNSISLVTSERIAERPSVTVTDHLKGQPGLSISNGGIVQANIVSRGFNNAFSTSMLMLQDYRFAGVPSLRVNVPFLFTGTSDDIDRIEILQGPASALYGPNSGSGVLHVITKSPFTSQGTTLTLDGGERSMFRMSGRHAGVFGNDKFGYKLSGEYFQANDWEYRDPNELGFNGTGSYSTTDTRVPASRRGQPIARDFGLSKYSGEARLDYRPSEDTEAITTFGYTMAGSALEVTTTFGAAQVQNWSYTNFQQRFRHKQFFAQVFYNQSDAGNNSASDDAGTYYLRSGIPVVDKSYVMVAQAQQGFTLGNTKFTGGVDYIATTPQTQGTIMGRNENDDNIAELGGYLQFTQPLTEKLDFMGAVRGDMNSRIEGSQFSPRAAFLYKATPTQNFRFTFNRAFNSPASFAFSLDQYSGQTQNLGPALGNVDVQIFGNPSKEGWQYNRGCAASQASAGGLCMRNLAYGAAPGAIAGSTVFPQLMATNVAPGTPLALALAAAIPGLPAQQVANVAAGLGALVPTNAQAPLLLRNVLAPGSPVTPFSTVSDFSPLGANFSNTFELGYKGIIGDRLRISADYWYQIRPAEPTTQVINGDNILFMDPAALGAYLGNPANGVVGPGGLLANNGVPLANHGAIVTGWVTQIAGIPTGTLDFNNALYDRSYLVFTYQNAEGQVDVRGIDLAVDYLLDDMWSVEATYSSLSRNIFADAAGASVANPLSANTPKHRGSLTVRRVDESRGMAMELRGRYMDTFDVNSGVFNSFNIGTPNRYDKVPVNAFLDAGFSWKIPTAQNIRWSLNVQNILDNQVPSFVGVAPVGRFATTRIQYTF
jgi:outer membrane receptor for ferrienterochelin and colicins